MLAYYITRLGFDFGAKGFVYRLYTVTLHLQVDGRPASSALRSNTSLLNRWEKVINCVSYAPARESIKKNTHRVYIQCGAKLKYPRTDNHKKKEINYLQRMEETNDVKSSHIMFIIVCTRLCISCISVFRILYFTLF